MLLAFVETGEQQLLLQAQQYHNDDGQVLPLTIQP